MNEEEKKAIERFKANANYCITSKETTQTILNLIEKQQKEIEELNKYIEDRAKIGKNIQTFINKDYVEQEYISKDKIKAKIEELEQWELYNMKIPRLSTLDERLGAKIGIKYVLQSLLEKE